jgi:hypothetical protein
VQSALHIFLRGSFLGLRIAPVWFLKNKMRISADLVKQKYFKKWLPAEVGKKLET